MLGCPYGSGRVQWPCCVLVSAPSGNTSAMRPRRRLAPLTRSAFAGFRFPPEVIILAVRGYLRVGLSYRDVEELVGCGNWIVAVELRVRGWAGPVL
jgi:hypothetical protein